MHLLGIIGLIIYYGVIKMCTILPIVVIRQCYCCYRCSPLFWILIIRLHVFHRWRWLGEGEKQTVFNQPYGNRRRAAKRRRVDGVQLQTGPVHVARRRSAVGAYAACVSRDPPRFAAVALRSVPVGRGRRFAGLATTTVHVNNPLVAVANTVLVTSCRCRRRRRRRSRRRCHRRLPPSRRSISTIHFPSNSVLSVRPSQIRFVGVTVR